MNKGNIILQLEVLKVGYNTAAGKRILFPPINATVLEGEMIAVLGPNGIGKSTLLRTIARLQMKLGGTVTVFSKKIEDYSNSDLARKIGFVFAGGISVSNMTVYELVSLGRFPHTNWIGKLTKNDKNLIEESIENVGLSRYFHTNISELSDGEKQRAMIARTLAQDTDLIILDEPTAFLDLPNRYDLIHLLKKLIREKGKSVIFSSHDLHIAIREADKLWLTLNTGLEQGSPEDLAINGTLDSIFKDSPLEFDKDEGVFTYPVNTRMNIKLNGTGQLAYWTERALNRLGIKVNSESISPSITVVKDDSGYQWIYESTVVKREFNSIYDLIVYMKEVLSG